MKIVAEIIDLDIWKGLLKHNANLEYYNQLRDICNGGYLEYLNVSLMYQASAQSELWFRGCCFENLKMAAIAAILNTITEQLAILNLHVAKIHSAEFQLKCCLKNFRYQKGTIYVILNLHIDIFTFSKQSFIEPFDFCNRS